MLKIIARDKNGPELLRVKVRDYAIEEAKENPVFIKIPIVALVPLLITTVAKADQLYCSGDPNVDGWCSPKMTQDKSLPAVWVILSAVTAGDMSLVVGV
jgi:hypothetical protein